MPDPGPTFVRIRVGKAMCACRIVRLEIELWAVSRVGGPSRACAFYSRPDPIRSAAVPFGGCADRVARMLERRGPNRIRSFAARRPCVVAAQRMVPEPRVV